MLWLSKTSSVGRLRHRRGVDPEAVVEGVVEVRVERQRRRLEEEVVVAEIDQLAVVKLGVVLGVISGSTIQWRFVFFHLKETMYPPYT